MISAGLSADPGGEDLVRALLQRVIKNAPTLIPDFGNWESLQCLIDFTACSVLLISLPAVSY